MSQFVTLEDALVQTQIAINRSQSQSLADWWGEVLHMARVSGRRMKLEAALTQKGVPETVAASLAYHLVRDEDAID